MVPSPDPYTGRGGATKRGYDDTTPTRAQPDRKRTKISRKECLICLEDIAKNQYPRAPHAQSGSGQHSSDVCFKCYDQHIEAQVNGTGSGIVNCPQCSQALAEPEIRKLARHVGTYQK